MILSNASKLLSREYKNLFVRCFRSSAIDIEKLERENVVEAGELLSSHWYFH